MERSTIYAKCPGCGESTLVQHVQGSYVCAHCGFDYVARLAGDETALEKWAVDTMRSGPMGQLAVVYLYGRITKLPNAESIDRIKSIAARNGIDLPTGAPIRPRTIVVAVLGTLVAILVVLVVLSRI